MDTNETYTNRNQETLTVAKREESNGYYAITSSAGWTAGCSKEIYDLLPEGKEYVFETRNLSQIAGWLIDGVWYNRKSDQDFEREHAEFVAKVAKERQETLDKNREAWTAREAALPDWVRERIEIFHERGGENFEREGWGYELAIAELAVLYADMGEAIRDKTLSTVDDSEYVKEFAQEHGTSGNMHGMALALAKAHLEEPEKSMAGTVSALSPLTGEAFYEGDSETS